MPLIRATIADGLDRVAMLTPGTGFLNANAGLSFRDGAFANVEAGLRPRENIDLFAFGRIEQGWAGPIQGIAGVGLRVRF